MSPSACGYNRRMTLFSGLLKAGVVKKVVSEARKPENQQKVKDLYAKAQAKRGPKAR